MTRSPMPPSRSLVLFLAFAFLWLSANLVLRWINWPLFHGHGVYGWPQPGVLTLSALLLVSVSPVALLMGLLGLALRRLSCRGAVWTAFAVIIFLVMVVELDMSWYALSKTHISWRDVHMFLTESWSDHFGIRPVDIARFVALMGGHLAMLALAAGVALRWGGRLRLSLRKPVLAGVVLALVFFFAGQTEALVRATEGDKDQWVSVVRANPLIPAWWQAVADAPWWRDDGLEAMDQALRDAASLPSAPLPPSRPLHRTDVLLVVVEGWNARLFDYRTMPFMWRQKNGCRFAARHYATGNATHYGVLGLLFGTPPYFYRGAESEGVSGSPFITELAAQGYQTRRIGADLTIHRNLGRYLDNFTEPAIENKDDWKNLEHALALLQRPGPDFLYLHYLKTHFPYRHAPAYTIFTPEVAEDFDYFSPELDRMRPAVINRYRNTLRELDAWLAHLFRKLPPDTLLVVVGDHGEEMFEYGRLGHSSALNEAQTRTPWLLCGTGVEPGRWDQVTSHADVMPTVFSTLGLPQPEGARLGRDLWQVPGGAAVIAFNNHTRTPRRYRVVGESAWVEFKVAGDDLRAWRAFPSVQEVLAESSVVELAASLKERIAVQRR